MSALRCYSKNVEDSFTFSPSVLFAENSCKRSFSSILHEMDTTSFYCTDNSIQNSIVPVLINGHLLVYKGYQFWARNGRLYTFYAFLNSSSYVLLAHFDQLVQMGVNNE